MAATHFVKTATPPPSTNPFDPLTDIVGLPREETTPMLQSTQPQPTMNSFQHHQPLNMNPTMDQSADERVAAAKYFVGVSGASVTHTQNHSFGVAGANRQASLYPNQQHQQQQQHHHQQQQHHHHQQQQYTMMQMQMYATYNAMTVYNTYSNMTHNPSNRTHLQQQHPQQQYQQLVAYQPQIQTPVQLPIPQSPNMVMAPYAGLGNQRNMSMGFGGLDAGKVAPVMKPETTAHIPKKAFLVQRKKKDNEFVSEDDKAFKPLFNEFKASMASSK